MRKFYFLIWLTWFTRLTLCSIFFASISSFFVTTFVYLQQGLPKISSEVFSALYTIFEFWFALFWSLGVLIALFRGLKYIFNKCRGAHMLVLFTCSKKEPSELIEVVGYGDLIKVWRKWFLLMVWLVAAQMIIVTLFSRVISSGESLFAWFTIYNLYIFIAIAGYFSFIILSTKCKQVRIKKC